MFDGIQERNINMNCSNNFLISSSSMGFFFGLSLGMRAVGDV